MRTIRVRNGEHTFAYRWEPGQEDKILRAIALHLRQGKITRAGAAKLRELVRPKSAAPLVGAIAVGCVAALLLSRRSS